MSLRLDSSLSDSSSEGDRSSGDPPDSLSDLINSSLARSLSAVFAEAPAARLRLPRANGTTDVKDRFLRHSRSMEKNLGRLTSASKERRAQSPSFSNFWSAVTLRVAV
jgi:hypothetical protein